MYILGLTTLGDSAATLIRDGEIVAAAEEERFSRRKHHSGFPYHAMQYCLEEAGIKIADVAHVGLYWKPWVLRHKAMQALKSAVSSRDNAATGSPPGFIGATVHHPGSAVIAGTNPARTSDDLPHPDGPTTNNTPASTRSAGERSSAVN